MIATVVDTSALLKVLYASLIAGVSVTLVFSLAVLGATRAADLRRANRSGRAMTAYTVLAVLCLLLSAAIAVYGMILVANK